MCDKSLCDRLQFQLSIMLQASEYSALSPPTSLESVDKESERVG